MTKQSFTVYIKYTLADVLLFSSLDILPLPDLIIQQQLLIMHSIDQKYSTVNCDSVFIKNSALTDHPYPLKNADDFFLPRVRNDFLKKVPFSAFLCYGMILILILNKLRASFGLN